MTPYRGRIAPSPTGHLHLGHARTFWTAWKRAREQHGALVLRNEDLDRDRARTEFVAAFIEDLRWLGLDWEEGPDLGGAFGPYDQSQRIDRYRDVFERLRAGGFLFPCVCSRRDVLAAISAPHAGDEEPVYPGTCRSLAPKSVAETRRVSWRFRVPDGDAVRFDDGGLGGQEFIAGRDFGDFVVWRPDDLPSYQLACVTDDAAMEITEVVRGADLLVSTARQLLLYRALGWAPPAFFHCPLMTDDDGVRLAKRHAALSLRALRAAGRTAAELVARFH
jgi:glutamyl/glutaminyl-tRNA synthetase